MSIHRTNKEREALCNAWKQSGQTKKDFCRRNNIGKKSFYRWLSKPLNNKLDVASVKSNIEPTPINFLRVGNAIPARSFIPEESFLEITLPSGINFKVKTSQDNINNFLRELLKWK